MRFFLPTPGFRNPSLQRALPGARSDPYLVYTGHPRGHVLLAHSRQPRLTIVVLLKNSASVPYEAAQRLVRAYTR